MDSTSIITQASREEEQLTSFPPDKALTSAKKPRHKGFFNTLLCCFGRYKRPNPPIHAEDTNEPKSKNGNKHRENYLNNPTAYSIGQGFLPPGKHLLPQVKHQDVRKMCLVIDLDETLVHSSFKPISNADFIVPVEIDGVIHQVYVLKRPYVDEFLQKMGEMYECILFTASLAKYADPVADLLDKWGVFRARLFRESCVFYRGNYVKDLERLGRDLHRVIIVDNSPASYIFHQDNAVPVNSWFDDMSDTELRDLIPFLEHLSKMDDVYSVLCNSNHAAGSHTQANTLNGSHFISPTIQQMNGFMQPS